MTVTVQWDLAMTVLSSISHKDNAGGATTTSLLRRELIVQPDGSQEWVPVISGNAFRGVLRRIGEELMREELRYEGRLSLAAAHTLRSGGALRRISREPLSGRELERLRTLVPQIAVFGGASTGTIVQGRLQVGKVLPRVRETRHLLVDGSGSLPSQFDVVTLEKYSRFDDSASGNFPETIASDAEPGGQLMRYELETVPSGVRLESWVRLSRANAVEVSFFEEILSMFCAHGHLGGRQAVGHGRVATVPARRVLAGSAPAPVDWRTVVASTRDEALEVLSELS